MNSISKLIAACALALATPAFAADPGLDFFEQNIRPVLVEACYKCHSANGEKVKGGLLLDTREGLLKGGDSGPSIVPGDPEKSLFIKAIRYTDKDLLMPPKDKKLPAHQIAAFEQWVKMGAPDPRTGTNKTAGAMDMAAARKHWAFQPVGAVTPPPVKNERWVQSPIDRFILAKQEAKGLSPSPRADKRTLIRRASYDLTGLPPTAGEVDAFVADNSADAFARVVDRLLASPRYGERWGRYWLDVARYADTKGYVFEEERRYPFSYTYRDYVIRALNEDLPYDQFVVQQLAADLLPLGEDKRALAAMGFLTLGRRFLNNQPDIIDDRLDLMGRGLMGLTVACARCHDHKSDPIPTKDYYSLYGVFASSEEPGEKPLLGNVGLPSQYPEYLAEKKKREEELKSFLAGKEAELMTKMHAQVGDYLLVARDAQKLGDKGRQDSLARERKLAPRVAQRWMDRLSDAKNKPDPILGAWMQFAALGETNFAERAKVLARTIAANENPTNKLNPLVAAQFTNAPASLQEVAERYNKLFVAVAAKINAPQDASAEALRQFLLADTSPFRLAKDELRRLFDTPAQQKERALKRKIDELEATHPGSPPRAMALADKSSPVEPVVFIRGNAGNPGAKVPRQFLEILSPDKRQPFKKGSGRLELAQSIASTNNPLTARVFVNRVWMQHFGAPLVRTPGDFGVRTEPPTHPELLDYLASRFMADGWSVKKLHRLIMLSAAYQQGSEENAANTQVDQANELLWRMNRRRLDFEAMRDTLLTVAGRLDLTMGGTAADITTQPFTMRRTVYSFIERQNLPGIFRTFDFASPDVSSSGRFATTVPQQALFLMNSPFVVEQAREVLARGEIKQAGGDEQRIDRLYRLAFQRAAQPEEIALAKTFLRAPPAATNGAPQAPTPAWQYGFGEFDAPAQRVKGFTHLPHFAGVAWQGGAKLPDAKLGWVMLGADGGHAGDDLKHAAIRRWTAPADGAVKIRARLDHAAKSGDGVRGRIVSSRMGALGEWMVHNTKATTNVERIEVKRGDTIDFVTDLRGGIDSDSFTWSPRVAYLTPPTDGARSEWKAKEDFGGKEPERKALTPWERYAQVLLLANETVFVD